MIFDFFELKTAMPVTPVHAVSCLYTFLLFVKSHYGVQKQMGEQNT